VHVAAGAEVAARTGDHHDLHVVGKLQRMKQVAQLGIRVEGERVLALGPAQLDRAHAVLERPGEVARVIAGPGLELGAHGVVGADEVLHGSS